MTFRMWGSMVTVWNPREVFGGVLHLGLGVADYVIIALGCILMGVVSSMSMRKSVRERLWDRPILSAILCGALFVVILTFGAYGIGYDASQFIYNQF